MIEPRLVLCSGVAGPAEGDRVDGRKVVRLDALGHDANVHIRLEDVARVLLRRLTPRLVDFLEIAAYIFSADAATSRGTQWSDEESTEAWSRDFHFVIPVRDPAFWSREDVGALLNQTLIFLANDRFAFTFPPLVADRPAQEYLDLGRDWDDWPFDEVDRVLMFSGGLDSLAGAVETAAAGGNLVLVSHRPVGTLDRRQKQLFAALQRSFPRARMVHVPVWLNKDTSLGRESTQRTRSFLFAALGTVVAESLGAGGVRFFENGVVSLNLPVADEVLRARASRTTHPRSLHLLAALCALVVDRPFAVDNPYLFRTKTEVVERIAAHGTGDLIGLTCSCAHTIFKSKTQWHCGTCSQCIDRRVAILAAGVAGCEDPTDYVSDVFTGPRAEGYERNMAIDYARHATELEKLGDRGIAELFNLHLTRAARHSADRRGAAEQLVALHQRHAAAVCRVLRDQLRAQGGRLLDGALEPTSMLALIAGQRHLTTTWRQYADRIAGLLQLGIPVACATEKPRNEPHLQQLCDGILRGQDLALTREYPFMRWSSSLTKPDWSANELDLWVELKYVRKKTDIRQITEDIAADITKYGDNGQHVLFVVYDPTRLITDDDGFAEPIQRRQTMRVRFIR